MRRFAWLGFVLLVVACGSDRRAGGPPPDRWPPEELAAATPIAVGWVPEGYELDLAEEGDHQPLLSDDYGGTVEPSLLLAPVGWDGTLDDVLAVGAVHCSGMQGGCSQASSYAPTTFELDGRRAVYSEGARHDELEDWQRRLWWPNVLVWLGDLDGDEADVGGQAGWAARVSGPTASRELLAEVAAHAEVDGERLPVLDAVPEGWEVVSRISAPQIDAADAFIQRDETTGRVAVDGFALGWAGPDDSDLLTTTERLTVVSVDGSETHLAAIAALRGQTASSGYGPPEVTRTAPVEVDGRAGWVSEGRHDTVVAFALEEGGVVIVDAVGDDRPAVADVVRVAESVRPLELAEWEAMIADLNGGSGLQPFPGRDVLARGTFEGTEWLLQSTGPAGWSPWTPFDGPAADAPASCIDLAGGRRSCASGGSGGAGGGAPARGRMFYDRGADNLPSEVVFAVGLVDAEVASVRVSRPDGDESIPTVALPGSTARLYVVPFRDGEQGAPIVAVDAAGAEVGSD